MKNYSFDFYNSSNLKTYNFNEKMRKQLLLLNKMDPITKKHSENVASIVCQICEYKGFDWDTIVFLTMNAYFHDIGKLKIPPEVLHKPGKLTDEEYNIIKTHTSKGYEICMSIEDLKPYALGAYYHHEALNGTGYPQGLTKKDIPYIAQIIRIADEYEALTAKRQYKTHIDISETLKILLSELQPSGNSKDGKINPQILKILFKVVIDNIVCEISCVDDYIKYLKSQIGRLETVHKYYIKMINSSKDKDKMFFLEGIKLLLESNETLDNFNDILNDYKNLLVSKESARQKLYDEIKIIQKLNKTI